LSRLAAFATALLVAGTASASPGQTIGFGSRGTALGGAVSADVRDSSAVFYNPSGLCLGEGTELSLGYSALTHDLTLGDTPTELDSVVSLEGGIVARGAIAELPFAFGLAFDLPNGHLSKVESFREGEPHWALYESSPEIVDIGAMIALKPTKFLAIGGGLGFLAATKGGFHVQLRHEVQADLGSVRYPVLGLTLMPHDRVTFALSFRDEVVLEQRITGTLAGMVDATITKIPVHYQFESIALIGFLPREFRLGTSVRAIERLTLNLDLVWQDWSGYPSPVASSAATLEANVPAGLMIDLPENSPRTIPVPPGFEDRIVPRLGIESTFPATPKMSLAFRAGYAFEESPAARHQLSSALIDADRHVVSFGTGFVWTRPAPWLPHTLRFDSHALFARLIERSMQVEVAGQSRRISASGTVWSVGATVGIGFQ